MGEVKYEVGDWVKIESHNNDYFDGGEYLIVKVDSWDDNRTYRVSDGNSIRWLSSGEEHIAGRVNRGFVSCEEHDTRYLYHKRIQAYICPYCTEQIGVSEILNVILWRMKRKIFFWR